MEALEHPLTYAHFQFSKPSPAAGKLLIVAGNPEENNNDSTAIGIGPSNFRAEAMLRGGKRRSRGQGKPPSSANYWSQESEFNLVTNRMALRQDLCQAPTALLLRAIQIGPHCSKFSDPPDRTGSGCIPTCSLLRYGCLVVYSAPCCGNKNPAEPEIECASVKPSNPS